MSRGAEEPDGLLPSQVRARILDDHRMLRRMLIDVDTLASALLSHNSGLTALLRERSRILYEALCRHIELEDRILAPALRETPGFGEVRAQQLREHHVEQRRFLFEALEDLDRDAVDPAQLALRIRRVVADIRCDMAHEDQQLLSADLLKDDPIHVSFIG